MAAPAASGDRQDASAVSTGWGPSCRVRAGAATGTPSGVDTDQGNARELLVNCDGTWQVIPAEALFPTRAGGAAAARVDPQTLALRAVTTLDLHRIQIGITPPPPDGIGIVGIPTWLWIANPNPTTTGPQFRTATDAGIRVSLTARLSAVDWDMGDGTTVHCTGPHAPGTPWTRTAAEHDPVSPTCGHTYTRQGDPYTITATAHWTVTWTQTLGGTATGTIPIDLITTTTQTVGEYQAITTG